MLKFSVEKKAQMIVQIRPDVDGTRHWNRNLHCTKGGSDTGIVKFEKLCPRYSGQEKSLDFIAISF